MGKSRLEFHDILCEVLGSKNCYFKPPTSLRMNYPCIRYNHERTFTETADNFAYKRDKRYTVTVIDEDPDSDIPEKLFETFEKCANDRNYQMNGLNHFVFTIYY